MCDRPRTDFHIHATAYRPDKRNGEMTVAAIAQRCAELSFDAVGIMEHLNHSPKHSMDGLEALAKEARSFSPDVTLYAGAELDILDDTGAVTGSAALKDKLGLDFLLAAVHGALQSVSSISELVDGYQRLLMGVVEHCDFIDVVAHPWAGAKALSDGSDGDGWSYARIPEHYREELLHALSERGIALELNRRSLSELEDPHFREFYLQVRESGVRIAIGSDAHKMEFIGASLPLDDFLRELEFPPEQIWLPDGRT